ncbi:MAG TPA: hypothetical protein VMU19_00350, partial [Bryobacteraceae bacterium]|nr:hypothetical protein [Bryobacteraceae bacterium]
MRMESLALSVCAALCLCVPIQAQNATWTASGSPVIATLSGGPWLLQEGGPYTETNGATTAGGPVTGSTPYCSAGVPISNQPVNSFQPFYFPFIYGRGLNLQGYFDYRPRNVNEALAAATTSDGGKTWSFQQQVENLTSFCPNTDTNGATGNDDGLGHPYVLQLSGGYILYMLDRRNGWVDSSGMIVHTLTPKASGPLYGLPAASEFSPPTGNIITQWNFEYTGGSSSSPTPNIGSGTATALGMTNSYANVANNYTGSTNKDDITGTTGGTNPDPNAMAWRIRGTTKNNGGASGPGWNTLAPQYSQGAQFMVSTAGHQNIVFEFDWYTTAQAPRDLQAEYTTDGSTWTKVGPLYVAPIGGGYYPQIIINFPALGITAVNNNANFGVRLVSAYDPTYTGAGSPTYTGATLIADGNTGAGTPTPYNNASGNWRFDEVNVLGTPTSTNTIKFPTRTTGLINPDGILAAVPNSYPFKILYVSKTLNGDYAFNSSQQCTAVSGYPAANHDVDQIRLATSRDGITWTDGGTVNGLNDPTTVSAHAVRYMAPNGSLVKLSTGAWGLFFGGGNCLDGDSDGFHAIMYAESSDLANWTVYNGIDNPIASVSPTTDPANSSLTIPANTPVIGATQD